MSDTKKQENKGRGFKIESKEDDAVIRLKQGPMRPYKKGEPLFNEIGVDLALEPNSGDLTGKIVLHGVTTEIKDKKQLIAAIESFVNETLKATL